MAHLTVADLPVKPGAYQDNNGDIWLLLSDPPSKVGLWRVPDGFLAKPGNHLLEIVLDRRGVTELRRMVPVRRKT